MSEATVKRNPKMEGMSSGTACRKRASALSAATSASSTGPGAYYTQRRPCPTPEEVGDDIVRMNCGNDTNINRALVIETAKRYKHAFFNTSVRGKLDFPGPVVLTANPKEEEQALVAELRRRSAPQPHVHPPPRVQHQPPLHRPGRAMVDQRRHSRRADLHVLLRPRARGARSSGRRPSAARATSGSVRHINSYWCPTKDFMRYVMKRYEDNRLVSMCGSIDVGYCRACRNCETYYHGRPRSGWPASNRTDR